MDRTGVRSRIPVSGAAVQPGELELHGDRARGGEQAGIRLEDDVLIVGEGEDRLPLVELPARTVPVRDPQLLQAGRDPRRIVDARGREGDSTGADIERLARVGLELPPGAECRRHQPGVSGIGIRVPRDPRRAVRAAPAVAELELLDQDDRLAPSAR